MLTLGGGAAGVGQGFVGPGVCGCVRESVCVLGCVCVCERECVCVCVCV